MTVESILHEVSAIFIWTQTQRWSQKVRPMMEQMHTWYDYVNTKAIKSVCVLVVLMSPNLKEDFRNFGELLRD